MDTSGVFFTFSALFVTLVSIEVYASITLSKIYNPGKNNWDTLSDLEEKETPFPQRNVDPTHVIRSFAISPTLI